MSRIVVSVRPPEIPEQVEDLRLDRDVERRRRLVGDQQRRLVRERGRDHDALPHASGQAVGRIVVAALGLGDADVAAGARARASRRARRRSSVRADRLGDLAPDREARVERRHRILEHHADAVAAQRRACRRRRRPTRSRPWKRIAPAHVGGSGEQAHEREGERRLAASGLADQAEDLALRDARADTSLTAETSPALDRKSDVDVVDLRGAAGHRVTPRGSRRSRSPSPIRLNASTVIAIASPGKISTQGACVSTSRPSASMTPSDGVGGCAPSPRNDSAASICEREAHQHARLDDRRARSRSAARGGR